MNIKRLHSLGLLLLLSSTLCHASDWRLGLAFGYGGTGISQPQTINGSQVDVSRDEGPGLYSLFVDRLVSDYSSLSFEHIQGFRLGPFSAGVTFDGFTYRHYLLGPAPSMNATNTGESTLFVKRYAPFIGVGTGVAFGDVHRDNELTSTIQGSGVWIGVRVGADYPIRPGFGIRPEISYSTTFFYAETPSTSLTEFALQLGLYFFL